MRIEQQAADIRVDLSLRHSATIQDYYSQLDVESTMASGAVRHVTIEGDRGRQVPVSHTKLAARIVYKVKPSDSETWRILDSNLVGDQDFALDLDSGTVY